MIKKMTKAKDMKMYPNKKHEPHHTTVFKLIIVLTNALSTQQVGWLVIERMGSNGDGHIVNSHEWRKRSINHYNLQSCETYLTFWNSLKLG